MKISFKLSTIALLISSSIMANAANSFDTYPPVSPPTSLSTEQKIIDAANWLNANVNDVQLSPGLYALMPRSYQTSWQNYWGYLKQHDASYQNYIANHDTHNCSISSRNDATIERAVTANGLDVYDGAVWMMGLADAFSDPKLPKANKDYLLTSIEQYKKVLFASRSEGFTSYRAFKSEYGGYHYGLNRNEMPNANQSYLLKFITPSWAHNSDPLNHCDMQWPIYDAVTGEQSWAALIAPIQTAYLINQGNQNPHWANDSWINFAIDSLPSLIAMQDPTTGGVYRNVALPGNPSQPDLYAISLENDFSLYAGLDLLEQAIKSRMENTPGKGQQSARLDNALNKVDQLKKGLIKFFSDPMTFTKEGYFVASVDSNGGTPKADDTFALDVQTWGISVILSDPKLKDAVIKAHGADSLYRMWQAAIKYSGYRDSNNRLIGVGYTKQTPSDDFYEMSGEWTLGAINAAIDLANYYGATSEKGESIINDAKDMQYGINTHIATLIDGKYDEELGYLYANKRATIPFGWYSNAMPATATTAWALMVNSCYNPFVLGGEKDSSREYICELIVK